jgi:hypothetical protein
MLHHRLDDRDSNSMRRPTDRKINLSTDNDSNSKDLQTGFLTKQESVGLSLEVSKTKLDKKPVSLALEDHLRKKNYIIFMIILNL